MKFSCEFTRTRVKICGLTRPDDALAAARFGADAIGLVFCPSSPRCVTLAQAEAILQVLPPFVCPVALFVDERIDRVRQLVSQLGIPLVQLHGDESPEYCGELGIPFVKAIRMHGGLDLAPLAAAYGSARGLLLDAWHPELKGGTGEVFDWGLVRRDLRLPVILAGGLRSGNVAEAIQAVRPYAVDVSSGVESAPGVKDRDKMKAFLQAVKSFDDANSSTK